jgi:hypothetical protein
MLLISNYINVNHTYTCIESLEFDRILYDLIIHAIAN